MNFSPYRLLPFETHHRDALIGLVARCYVDYGQVIELDSLDEDLLVIEEKYAGHGCDFRVLLDGNRLIGSVAFRGEQKGRAELKRVFLDSEYRGRGLGKKLSLWAFDAARESGIAVLDIWSDTLFETAHHLYRGLGAKETGQTRYLGGRNEVSEIHFEMELDP